MLIWNGIGVDIQNQVKQGYENVKASKTVLYVAILAVVLGIVLFLRRR